MKIKITDKEDPNCGKVYEGEMIYCDVLHGRKIDGQIQDLYVVNIDGEEKQYMTRQIDADYYYKQKQEEEEARLGFKVGDIVKILKTGSGSVSRGFYEKDTHVVTDICWTGNVEFDNGLARMFRPKVEVVGHCSVV